MKTIIPKLAPLSAVFLMYVIECVSYGCLEFTSNFVVCTRIENCDLAAANVHLVCLKGVSQRGDECVLRVVSRASRYTNMSARFTKTARDAKQECFPPFPGWRRI